MPVDDDTELRHVEKAELDDLVEAQNEIFSDYIVPMRSSRSFFMEFLESVGGRIENVMVATHRGRIVGYVNPVLDGPEVWIGGVGVIPGHRGRGLGKKLMLAAEEFSRSRGVGTSLLEVIEGNEAAMSLYRSLGYRETRRFLCAEGKPVRFVGYGEQPKRASVEEIAPMHLEAYRGTCWQRRKRQGLASSARASECYRVGDGFVLVRKVDAIGYVPYLGVVPRSRRQGTGTSLAKFALNRLYELGAFKVAVYNLNEEPAVLSMLDKFDFKVTMKQVEMMKSLT
jgi:ribosomal protein S18 acetylase RimI-like enzyme